MEHLTPEALAGPTRRTNLWAACRQCNGFKGDRIAAPDPETGRHEPLFNPREHHWLDHFAWVEGGLRIAGQTPIGRATVEALELNRAVLVRARRLWIAAGWHPRRNQPQDELRWLF